MIENKVFPNTIEQVDFILKAAVDEAYAEELADLVVRNQGAFKYIEYTQSLTTPDKARQAIRSMAEKWQKGTAFHYFIFDKTGTLLGCVALKKRVVPHLAECSYYLDKNAKGNGYVTRSIRLLGDIFLHNGGHRLEICCHEKNTESIAVAQRLGCHLDGSLRDFSYKDGEYQDVLVYSLLTGEL